MEGARGTVILRVMGDTDFTRMAPFLLQWRCTSLGTVLPALQWSTTQAQFSRNKSQGNQRVWICFRVKTREGSGLRGGFSQPKVCVAFLPSASPLARFHPCAELCWPVHTRVGGGRGGPSALLPLVPAGSRCKCPSCPLCAAARPWGVDNKRGTPPARPVSALAVHEQGMLPPGGRCSRRLPGKDVRRL